VKSGWPFQIDVRLHRYVFAQHLVACDGAPTWTARAHNRVGNWSTPRRRPPYSTGDELIDRAAGSINAADTISSPLTEGAAQSNASDVADKQKLAALAAANLGLYVGGAPLGTTLLGEGKGATATDADRTEVTKRNDQARLRLL
jgi:hypothetical protein